MTTPRWIFRPILPVTGAIFIIYIILTAIARQMSCRPDSWQGKSSLIKQIHRLACTPTIWQSCLIVMCKPSVKSIQPPSYTKMASRFFMPFATPIRLIFMISTTGLGSKVVLVASGILSSLIVIGGGMAGWAKATKPNIYDHGTTHWICWVWCLDYSTHLYWWWFDCYGI